MIIFRKNEVSPKQDFMHLKRLWRDILITLGIRKKKILVLSNQRSMYSETFEDFRILSQFKNPKFDSPVLCSGFDDFITELRKGYEIVHIAVHGNKNAIDVSDNELNISHERIKRLFYDNVYTELVFLNVCESDQLAKDLSEYVPFVIGWSDVVVRDDFNQFCKDFYKFCIECNESVKNSYFQSFTAKQTCHLFSSKGIGKKLELINRLRLVRYLIIVLFISILVLSYMWIRIKGSPKIDYPENYSEVNIISDIQVSAFLISNRLKLWIFVSTPGYTDNWWPQGQAEYIDGKWKSAAIFGEEGDSGDFKICARIVNSRVDKDLQDWMNAQFTDFKNEPLNTLPRGSFFYKSDTIIVKRTK